MNLFKQLLRFWKMSRRVGGPKAAAQLARDAPKYGSLFVRLLSDPRVPIAPKAALVAGVAFAVSPFNLPQYIPVVGALDDLGIALFVGGFFLKQVPAPVLAEHRRAVGLSESFEAA